MTNLKIQLPEGFLDEEERCGHLVTAEMKQAWAVMLDLLAEFDRVCKKHNIRYFASGGTMLGAVRHKGFIPWDDDIDVMMERPDYVRLSQVAEEEFKHPYFFQTKYTDPCCADSIAKLRNSETTALLDVELKTKMDYNRGIFIDIFVLDHIPDGDGDELKAFYQQINEQKQRVYKVGRSLGIFSDSKKPFQHFVKNCLHKMLTFRRKRKIAKYLHEYREFEKRCQQYNHRETKRYSLVQFGTDSINVRNKADFENLIIMDFEFLKIPVGANYDHALRFHFGDNYMEFIKGASMHSEIFFDTDRSYQKK